jgi:hypothetical protein
MYVPVVIIIMKLGLVVVYAIISVKIASITIQSVLVVLICLIDQLLIVCVKMDGLIITIPLHVKSVNILVRIV